jgi:hypothetical protein
MPKKPNPDKKTSARNRASKAGFRKTPTSINDLLLRKPTLQRLAERIPEQQSWTEWLRAALPEELRAHIVNVVPKALGSPIGATELVVSADAAVWCARVRFALATLESEIVGRDAAVQRTRVRVGRP